MHFSRTWSAARQTGRIWDAIENARDAACNWITVEMEEFDSDLPFSTHVEDIKLEEGQLVKMISVRIKLLPDND